MPISEDTLCSKTPEACGLWKNKANLVTQTEMVSNRKAVAQSEQQKPKEKNISQSTKGRQQITWQQPN